MQRNDKIKVSNKYRLRRLVSLVKKRDESETSGSKVLTWHDPRRLEGDGTALTTEV